MGKILLESGIIVLLVLIGISVFISDSGNDVNDVIVDFENSVDSGEVIEDGNIENVEIESIGSSFEDWKFKEITISKTIYYQITVDENGVPKVVNPETYVAPEQTVISLQPLNK